VKALDAPLSDVRVLDLSRVIAGPYVGRVFADLGADVIKLEPPGGDEARQIAPKHDRGMSGFLNFANVGKRSLCVDLQEPAGVELVLDLVSHCDVVLENFRPGVIERLGLGWDVVHETNPGAVLLSLNGFGRDSIWSDRRAYAPIVHAVTGILDDQAGYADQPIAQHKDAHADTVTALHAAVAVLAALRAVARGEPGQWVEVPMFDAVLSTYNITANEFLEPPDDRVMNPIYQAGSHGSIATAGSVQHVFSLIRATHSDFADPAPPGADIPTKARLRHAAIEDWMSAQASLDALLARLAEARIACAPVATLREAMTGELAQERELLSWVDDRRGGRRPIVRPPARFSASKNQVRGPAPRCGEHNEEVLRELLGYPPDRIRELQQAGVLAQQDVDVD
jgi:CoA:oxalate CoA-transferase